MLKRLIKHGNSTALIIDRPILALLGLQPGSDVDLMTYGRALVIVPRDELEAQIDRALDDEAKRGRILKALME